MTTEERIENLEKGLAALRAELAERMRTRAIEVVDDAGKTRAMLEVAADEPGLVLTDAAGRSIWKAP
ncbi:MAG: hypothetical protein NTX87_06680 [Planctomycetota bacterium]|nr:hypothetical protein [Planctomycetota bacterium]